MDRARAAGEDGEQDDDGGESDEPNDEPQTREELQKIRERLKGNVRTAAYFYHQRPLQIEMRIIYLGTRLVHEEFQEGLDQQKSQATAKQASTSAD